MASSIPNPPNLSFLPTELLLKIWDNLDLPPDQLHLILVCRRVHALFLPSLYTTNVQQYNSSALFWACETGSVSTAKHSLAAGAPANKYRLPPRVVGPRTWLPTESALIIALRSSDPPVDWLEISTRMPGVRDKSIRLHYENPLERQSDELQAKLLSSLATWPPTTDLRHARRANTPLGTACHHRHLSIVQLLLDAGADPDQADGLVSPDHQRVWSPLHWAISCGRWSGGGFFQRTRHEPVAPDPDIVAALLAAGADPNAQTADDPVHGRIHATNSHRSDEAEYPLHMAVCEHVPVEVVQHLLDAGVDQEISTKAFGCAGYRIRGMWTALGELGPQYGRGDERRDKKMVVLLLKKAGKTGDGYVVDGDTAPGMFKALSTVRLEVLEMIIGRESPGVEVKRSGVYALMEVWKREKELLESLEDGELGGWEAEKQMTLMKRLKGLLLFLVRNFMKDENTDEQSRPEDLEAVFFRFCGSHPSDGPVPVGDVVDLGQYDGRTVARKNELHEQMRELQATEEAEGVVDNERRKDLLRWYMGRR